MERSSEQVKVNLGSSRSRLLYHYLSRHEMAYYLATAPLLGSLACLVHFCWPTGHGLANFDAFGLVFTVGLLGLIAYVSLDLMPPPTYLLHFACYCPPTDLKIPKQSFMELAEKSGNFTQQTLTFMQKALNNSGIGDQTYMPRSVFRHRYSKTLREGREEAATVIFSAVDDLLSATNTSPKDIGILVVNCGILNTTPSLSAMVINRYKLRHNIQSFNLGGMGCAAGIAAVDLTRDLLAAYPGSYALLISTEIVSFSWYSGNDIDMVVPNCFLRMGAAAALLSSRRLDWWKAKYQLKQVVRTHKGMDSKSYNAISLKEDGQGKQGLSVSKDVIDVGGCALKDHITTLGPLVLPLSEQLHFFAALISKKTYIPNYKLVFEHVCVQATSKKVLDKIQKTLELSDECMEVSRKTLERFGNTSSSSVWYELAYLEAHGKVKKGDRVWQIAFGSGFKCNSAVWKAVRNVGRPSKSPWFI